MSYFLTEEQELIRNLAREFTKNEVEPRAVAIDANDEFPADLVKRCGELGFLGVHIPEEYGGTNAGITTACVIIEEISKASPTLGGLLMIYTSWPAGLVYGGSPYQKEKYLPGLASGAHLGTLAHTEPAGAMNLAAHETKLVRNGNGYILNGLKIFNTHGDATVWLVGARTSRNGDSGYGYALVDKGTPGFEIGKNEKKLGWRGSGTGTVMFKDVHVPEENILGDLINGGASFGMGSLYGNLTHAAASLGGAEGLYDKTLAYIKQRNLYGMPMTMLQPVSYWMAEMWVKIEACRALLYDTTRLFEMGQVRPDLASACKAFICDAAFEITSRLMQLWGGHAIIDETGINRYMRDARTALTAEASSEMHLSNIAQAILA